jgi:hypothetical protein
VQYSRESDPIKGDHFSHHPQISSLVSWIQIAQTAVQETESATADDAVEQLFMRQMHSLVSASARERPF